FAFREEKRALISAPAHPQRYFSSCAVIASHSGAGGCCASCRTRARNIAEGGSSAPMPANCAAAAAKARAAERLPLGVGAGQDLRRNFACDAERLEDAHHFLAALDADGVELAPDERVAGQCDRCLRSDDGRAVKLVRTFESRSEIHHVAHHCVVEAPP